MANNLETELVQLDWNPIEVRLGDLDPWPDNPREIEEDQAKRLLAGTGKFGQVETIAIGPPNGDGRHPLYNGHQRYFTWERAYGPDHVVKALQSNRPLTLDEQQELTIVLHKGATGQFAFDKLINWDPDKLMEWGFPKKELRAEGFEIDQQEADDDEGPAIDQADELRDKWETELGQIWTLGDHRILCGDSTKLEDVTKLMDGETAVLCATDPPYFIDYTGERNVTGVSHGLDHSRYFDDSYDPVKFNEFYTAAFQNVLAVLAPHGAIYCWHAHKRLVEIESVWSDLDIHYHQPVIWVKPAPLFGSVFFHFQHEPCMFGWRQGSMPPHDGDHTYSTVWELGNDKHDYPHPTQKPIELFARPMRKHTEPGGICFEPFLGAGAQLIAAEQMKRRCYGIEIEPAYIAVSLQRWVDETGGVPVCT